MSEPTAPSNFIRTIIDADLAAGKNGARVITRFPPEPNGYLHIGHAKSICLNFGLALDYGGRCHLRFDDTNPLTEDPEYTASIQNDVRWLGFDWGEHLYHVSDYFEQDAASPYMLIVAPVREELRLSMTEDQKNLFGIEKLKLKRSELPAITHVDYSARVQTVHEDTNRLYHKLIKAFEARTGCGVLVNTSFNVRGEPIVCTPEDAYRCFMRTEMDYLVLENYLLAKMDQPEWEKDDSWQDEFDLD